MNKNMIYHFGVRQFIDATRQWRLFAYVTTDQKRDSTIVISSLKPTYSKDASVKDNFTDASTRTNEPRSG